MIYFNYKVEYVSEKAIQLNDVFVSGDCVVLGDHEYEKIDKHDCVFLQRKRNFDRSAMPNAVFGIRLSEDEKRMTVFIQIGDYHIFFIFLVLLFFILVTVVSIFSRTYVGICAVSFMSLLALFFLNLLFNGDKHTIESDSKKEFQVKKISERGGYKNWSLVPVKEQTK